MIVLTLAVISVYLHEQGLQNVLIVLNIQWLNYGIEANI